jgi:predicted nucleic acid-binding protein
MTYALDSNIISYLLRQNRNPEVAARFEAAVKSGGDYAVPPLVFYEITWYLQRKAAAGQMRRFLELYQGSQAKATMTESDFSKAAQIKAGLGIQGLAAGDADIFIAAFCLNRNFTLVTNNTKHFEHIGGLQLANWKD